MLLPLAGSADRGCGSFSHCGVEAIYERFCEHPLRIAESMQPNLSKRCYIKRAERTVRFTRIFLDKDFFNFP